MKKDTSRKETTPRRESIQGIYNYCDRWCERCPFTGRCENYTYGKETFVDPASRDVGDGSFELPRLTRVEINGGENLKWLLPLDSDGDGFRDLAALSERGSLVLLVNNGDGTFEPRLLSTGGLSFLNPFLPSTPFLPFLAATDFTGDGVQDLIWVSPRHRS